MKPSPQLRGVPAPYEPTRRHLVTRSQNFSSGPRRLIKEHKLVFPERDLVAGRPAWRGHHSARVEALRLAQTRFTKWSSSGELADEGTMLTVIREGLTATPRSTTAPASGGSSITRRASSTNHSTQALPGFVLSDIPRKNLEIEYKAVRSQVEYTGRVS